jgi:hypothetical protein
MCFFFISLPASYFVALPFGYGLDGLWYGYGIGLLILNFLYIRLIVTVNWHEKALEIQEDLERQLERLDNYNKVSESESLLSIKMEHDHDSFFQFK